MSVESVSLKELLQKGIKKLEFERVASRTTGHTSHHKPVDVVHAMQFNSLTDLKIDSHGPKINMSSHVLRDMYESDKFRFSNEGVLRDQVKNLVKDYLSIWGIKGLEIQSECSVTIERDRSLIRPDLWVVYLDGRPLMIIEVKSFDAILNKAAESPTNRAEKLQADDIDDAMLEDEMPLPPDLPIARSSSTIGDSSNAAKDLRESQQQQSILENTAVLGQALDYLKNMEQFHGCGCLFGIVTSFKEWRIVGLPGCEAAAAATTTSATEEALLSGVSFHLS